IFDAVKTVFAKNMEEHIKEEDRLKKSRSVITKIVNALTAKSEIGSPMASMYLLNHFDHYTSHIFQRFYWKQYVDEPSVVITKNKKGFVAISPILDYTLRPQKYEHVNLYDWIRLSNKIKITSKNIQDKLKKEWTVQHIIQHKWINNSKRDAKNLINNESESDNHSDYSQSDTETTKLNKFSNIKNDINSSPLISNYHSYDFFLPDHPQYDTHKVCVNLESKSKVPDFIGGVLPRHDRGDREEYCMTMLTFFRPWRKGQDLKTLKVTWNDEFERYNFSIREQNIIKYFNLRYECNDARDDFAAQRRTQYYNENGWPLNIDSQTTQWLDTYDNNPSYTEFSNELNDNDSNTYSRSALSSLQKMIETEQLVRSNGLLD
ncbi:hypothetical protein BDY19DRAFT_866458, partial [Irpex rosettiformis]